LILELLIPSFEIAMVCTVDIAVWLAIVTCHARFNSSKAAEVEVVLKQPLPRLIPALGARL
jgi:hypothetical protein